MSKPKTTAKNLIDSSPVELVIRITDPAYTPARNAVTFALSVAKPGGVELISIPGWRVWKGAVVPPSTRKKNGSYFNTVALDPKIEQILISMVQEWVVEFPMVRFPSIDKEPESRGGVEESNEYE